MNAKELLQLKERHNNKIEEIRSKMIALERGYINDTTKYRVGDPYLLSSTKVKNKVVESYGFVKEIVVDYQYSELPVLRLVIYKKVKNLEGKEDDKYVKTLYL